MTATREDIQSWLEEAKASGATRVLIVCDTWDHVNYPVSVPPGTTAREAAARLSDSQRVDEVYDLTRSISEQLAETRALHWGDGAVWEGAERLARLAPLNCYRCEQVGRTTEADGLVTYNKRQRGEWRSPSCTHCLERDAGQHPKTTRPVVHWSELSPTPATPSPAPTSPPPSTCAWTRIDPARHETRPPEGELILVQFVNGLYDVARWGWEPMDEDADQLEVLWVDQQGDALDHAVDDPPVRWCRIPPRLPVEAHPEVCACGEVHWPALCCPGCDCGSYEEAHVASGGSTWREVVGWPPSPATPPTFDRGGDGA